MLKVKLIFFILLTMSLGFHVPSDVYAADGDVISTVEINENALGITLTNTDHFGDSVANIGDLDGDGINDLAVGAKRDDAGPGTDAGAVYILFMNVDGSVKSNTKIDHTTTNGEILGPTLRNDDRFGDSVANIGDLNGDGINDLAVGASYDDTKSDDSFGGKNWNAGAVHILFLNRDGTLAKDTEVINDFTTNGPALATGDAFGIGVANIGDLDGNGYDDLAVGAMKDNGGGSDRGAVHILFMDENGGLAKATEKIEDDNITPNGPALANDYWFGGSVANIGDFDGNGVNDLAVGANLSPGGGSVATGAVYILFMDEDPGNGLAKATVMIDDTTTNGPTLSDDDRFGGSVANIGDLDDDGINDLAVGARGDDEGGSHVGAVHIFFMSADGSVDSTVEINSSTDNGPTLSAGDAFGTSLANIGDLNGDGINDLAVGASLDNGGGSDRGAVHIMYMVGTLPSTTTSSGGGGGKNNCDSNGFGNNNSLRVYQVTYNIKTYEVQVQAYSTCGSISTKMTTPMQQSILGLSLEQTLLDDKIVIYSGYLDESEEKFNISVQNKKQSFDETFYIHDKSIIKKYTGETGYTSEQQGTALPTVTSEQITVVSEPSVTQIVQTIEESIPIEEQILDEPLETPKVQSIGYTLEPVAEEIKPQCGVGTKLVDGICKIIKTDEPKFCFLFWCW